MSEDIEYPRDATGRRLRVGDIVHRACSSRPREGQKKAWWVDLRTGQFRIDRFNEKTARLSFIEREGSEPRMAQPAAPDRLILVYSPSAALENWDDVIPDCGSWKEMTKFFA